MGAASKSVEVPVKILRAGLFRGMWRHFRTVWRMMFLVRGWPHLLADCTGLRRGPYELQVKSGARCGLRPGTSDWWIFLEIFIFEYYRRAEDDIRRARVIVDIGANVGFFALYAASLNPGIRIHAFEPFPENFEQMKKNLLLNPRWDVHPHPEAVSDKTGTVPLYFTPGDESGCSLIQTRGQFCSVNSLDINELFKMCGIDRCDLLKMDCEGSEVAIIQSANADVLAKIGALIMEYHSETDREKMSQILSRSGFTCEVLPQIKTLYACRG